MDEGNPTEDPQVTLYEATRADLMMIAGLTRGDHRDILKERVEGLRQRLVPKVDVSATKGAKRGPKAQP
jgi:hypothetical protein